MGLPLLAHYEAGALVSTWTRSELPILGEGNTPPAEQLLGQSLSTYFSTFLGIRRQDPVMESMDMKKRVLKEEESAFFSLKTSLEFVPFIHWWFQRPQIRNTAEISFFVKYDCYYGLEIIILKLLKMCSHKNLSNNGRESFYLKCLIWKASLHKLTSGSSQSLQRETWGSSDWGWGVAHVFPLTVEELQQNFYFESTISGTLELIPLDISQEYWRIDTHLGKCDI